MSKRRVSCVPIVALIMIVGWLAAVSLSSFLEHRQSKRIAACENNLKQLGLALYLYAEENKDRYPPIDDIQNNFMFDANLLYPEYLSDPMLAMCPVDPKRDSDTNFRLISDHPVDGTPKGEVHPDCFTDDSYVYLGWMVITDKEVEALFEAYDGLRVEDYDADITVPEGWGTLEGDTLHRLNAGVDRFLITDINVIGSDEMGASVVPILWDRPYMDASKFSHRPIGGNILYLDGHVEYWRFGKEFQGKEFPPMNEKMAQMLDDRPRERIPGCE